MYELKIYRRVIMCHDNEELCKIWRGIDLSFQNWHGEFDKFWLEHLEVSKMFTLMCSFWAEYILFELKKYRGVIFHDTEEWYKIWRGINMSFQNWHREFDKFWPEHLKISKILTLMGSFWAEYILFELKKYRGVIFHDTEGWYKIWRGIDLSFQNWQEEFDIVWLEHLEVSKFFPLMGSFWAKYILFELKNTEELSFMTWRVIQNLEWNQLVAWKLTWGIWQILTWSLESLKNIHFNGLLLSKVYIVWAKKVQRSYLSWHWRVIQNSERNRLVVCFKIDMRNLTNFDLSTWKFQNNFPLIGSFWAKYILFELKEYRGVIFHDTEEWYKIWRRISLF